MMFNKTGVRDNGSIGLPDYIYEDQEYIKLKTKPAVDRDLHFTFDCNKEKEEYIKQFKDKTLVFPAGIKYLDLKGAERLDCNLDFSKAVDLKSLSLVNPSYRMYINGRLISPTGKFRKINNWPPNLEDLILEEYSHPLDNLPNTLHYLKVACNFNHPLNKLPASLIELVFDYGSIFNHKLDSLPLGLKKLKLVQGMCYSHSLENLPGSLEMLDLGYDMYKSVNNLPDSIVYLTVGCVEEPIVKLPTNLKELKVWYDTMMYPKSITDYLADTPFPDSFETLKISYEYDSISKEDREKFQKIFGKKKINICYCD